MSADPDDDGRKPRTRWRPVDRVALVLAAGLSGLANLILVATVIQIIDHQTPDLTLSENATQILVAVAGGLVGLLGAYVGLNRKDDDEPPPGGTLPR